MTDPRLRSIPMTDAELDALDRLCQEVEGKVTAGEPDYLPSAGGHHVLLSDAEYRLYMAAHTAFPQLVAEVRRLRSQIGQAPWYCARCDEEFPDHTDDCRFKVPE